MKPFYYAGNKAGAYSLVVAFLGYLLSHLIPSCTCNRYSTRVIAHRLVPQ